MSLHSVLARPLLAAPFVVDGIDAVIHPAKHAEKVERITPTLNKVGIPEMVTSDAQLLVRICGAVTAVSALTLATGRRPRTSALTLALITVPVAVARNPVWQARTTQERREMAGGLLSAAGHVGGLFFAAADRGGEPSLRWRLANRVEQRRELRDVKAAAKGRAKEKYDS